MRSGNGLKLPFHLSWKDFSYLYNKKMILIFYILKNNLIKKKPVIYCILHLD